ncbi:hypothetical protein [Melaminivora jejuensis]
MLENTAHKMLQQWQNFSKHLLFKIPFAIATPATAESSHDRTHPFAA